MHFINETFSLIKLGASMSRQRSRGICQKSMQFKYNLINIRMNKRNKRSFSTQTTSKYMPPLSISVQMHSVGNACNWQLHTTKSKSKCISRHLNNLPPQTAPFNWMNNNSILVFRFRLSNSLFCSHFVLCFLYFVYTFLAKFKRN